MSQKKDKILLKFVEKNHYWNAHINKVNWENRTVSLDIPEGNVRHWQRICSSVFKNVEVGLDNIIEATATIAKRDQIEIEKIIKKIYNY